MRLPAIPPRRARNVIPDSTPNAQDNIGDDLSTQSQSPKLNGTANAVHDIELPIAITSYPSSVESESESDTSESEDESLSQHMLNMDANGGQPKKLLDIKQTSCPLKTNEASQQIQYVAVDVGPDEDGIEISSDGVGNKDEEEIYATAQAIVYTEIDKEMTLSLSAPNQARTKRDSGDF